MLSQEKSLSSQAEGDNKKLLYTCIVGWGKRFQVIKYIHKWENSKNSGEEGSQYREMLQPIIQNVKFSPKN